MSQAVIRKTNRFNNDIDDDDNYSHSSENLLYHKYPVIIGDFTLTKPQENRSIYTYKPKHTRTSYIYQGVANGAQVQQRALNEIRQYAKPNSYVPFMNKSNHYQSMLTLPSENIRTTTDDQQRDSLYDSLPRRSHSVSSLNFRFSPAVRIEPDSSYYFGKAIEEEEERDEEEEEKENVFVLGRTSQSRGRSLIKYSSYIPPIVDTYSHQEDNRNFDISFQEVADASTSTDDLVYGTHFDEYQGASLDPQASSDTQQSSRSETETYRVSRHYDQPENYERKIIKHPKSNRSSSEPSIVVPITNLDEEEEEEEEEEKEESQRSEPTPIVHKPISTHSTSKLNDDDEVPQIQHYQSESNLTEQSKKSTKSRKIFSKLFRRQKKSDGKSSYKLNNDDYSEKKDKKKHKKK